MPHPESSEINGYIARLTTATQEGSMTWAQVNPTTFTWDTRPPQLGRLSLQRVEKQETYPMPGRPTATRKVQYYIFQVIEIRPNATIPRLTVNSQEYEELSQPLEKLFQAIEQVQSRRSLDFLKSIIPPQQ